MSDVTRNKKICNAQVVREDGHICREIDITYWTIRQFNQLRHEYSVLGLDVRIKWVEEPAKLSPLPKEARRYLNLLGHPLGGG
jgi:hypothetical protein